MHALLHELPMEHQPRTPPTKNKEGDKNMKWHNKQRREKITYDDLDLQELFEHQTKIQKAIDKKLSTMGKIPKQKKKETKK